MDQDTTILLAEDDEGHALLILRELRKVGLSQKVIHFRDGQELLSFLGGGVSEEKLNLSEQYVLLLDMRMPKADGVGVLRWIKQSEMLKDLLVIMLTTTDNPEEISLCHHLGCNAYVVKPVDHLAFSKTIQSLGNFLQEVEVPALRSPLASKA